MEPVTVRKLDDRTETARKAAGIFVDAYYDDLKEISGSREILIDIFSKSLILSHFYGAYSCDSLMGIFALSDEKERSFRLDKRAVIEKIGFMKGHIVYGVLKRELERPIRMNKPGVYIEAVATDPGAQGRGIATKMMRHVIDNFGHSELDVVDTNYGALHIYRKLGFRVYKEEKARKNMRYSKKIYMEYDSV